MTKDVLVTVRGIHKGPDMDKEPIEVTARGEYFYKNQKHYILYEEQPEGEKTLSRNRIKITQGSMELTKSGPVSTTMLFEENRKHLTNYHTPYGSLAMGVHAKKVQICETETQISIHVDYALELDGEHMSDCSIWIEVCSRN